MNFSAEFKEDKSSPSIALLTPSRKGGIAVLALVGEEIDSHLDPFFEAYGKKKKSASSLRYGYLQAPDHTLDEVIIYKGDEYYQEIHCHGGLAIVREVIDLLKMPQISPSELLRRREELGSFSPLEREFAEAIPQVWTEKGLKVLLDQQAGYLEKKIDSLIKGGEENGFAAIEDDLQTLVDSYLLSRPLFQPLEVLILGAPNVGKSSLLNLLLDEEKAIVTDIPGTTRDVVSQIGFVEEIPFDFMDSAGLRSTSDMVESYGIEKARAHVDGANILIAVFDLHQSRDEETWKVVSHHREKTLLVLNKVDLAPHPDWETFLKDGGENFYLLSCLEKTGFQDFQEALVERAIPRPLPREILFTRRQYDLAHQALKEGAENWAQGRAYLKKITE